MVYINIIENYM